MSARDLLDRQDFAIPRDEDLLNTLYMIDLLAAWIRARRPINPRARTTTLAGTLLCPIFRTEKGPKFATAADQFRRRFAGLIGSSSLTAEYLERMKVTILELKTPEDVFGRSFSDFFNDRFEEPPLKHTAYA